MPLISVNDAELYYEDHGTGNETILFAHGLLWSGRMFQDQIEALKSDFRCISLDFRGQGRSQITADGYGIDQLTSDTIRFIELMKLGPVHFVGLSMGGFVGMRIAATRPDLIQSLALLNTSAEAEAAGNRLRYLLMTYTASCFGLRTVLSRVMPIMFAPSFLMDAAKRGQWEAELLSNRMSGLRRAVRGVVDRHACSELLKNITARTLVIVGAEDRATPPRKGQAIAAGIPNARLVQLSDCGHSSSVEKPEAVTKLLRDLILGSDSKLPDGRKGRDVAAGEER
jgi:3-oxoadipate enol-lactonase